MINHSSNLALQLNAVPDTQTEIVPPGRSELGARRETALLVSLAFERTPAPLVARALERHPSTVYAWTSPETLGLRAHDLLMAPRPFASTVLRGMLAAVEGQTCGFPSQSSFVHAVCGVVALCSSLIKEQPSQLTDEVLQRRLRELDQAASDLEQTRRTYEEEARRRGVRRAAEKKKGGAR